MFRSTLFALALGFAGAATAEEFPRSAQDVDVRGDDGTVIGRVSSVERNAEGEIVAVQINGLEPADAPAAANDLVADVEQRTLVRYEPNRDRFGAAPAGGERIRLR